MIAQQTEEPQKNAALLSHLQTRRTVPSINLAGERPSKETIIGMLTIAARVPDHGKLVPWRFVIYPQEESSKIGQYLSAVWQETHADAPRDRLNLEKTRFCRAPLVIGVLSKPQLNHKIPVWEQELSAGAVCLNLVHAAFGFGYVSQWLSEWYAYDPKTARFLGAGPGERFAGFIHIGMPLIEPSERPRPNISEITTHWSP